MRLISNNCFYCKDYFSNDRFSMICVSCNTHIHVTCYQKNIKDLSAQYTVCPNCNDIKSLALIKYKEKIE